MKKILIFTINTDDNFGNRLQNYAVQETFKKYNLMAETVLNCHHLTQIRYLIKYPKKIAKKFLFFRPKFARHNKFVNFDKKYIKKSKYNIYKNNIPKKILQEYDYYITGSDQVWNPNFGRTSDIDFLTFLPKEKRNAISASFGISDIPETYKEKYKKNLSEMNLISVREDRAKEIIEELTGRKDVEVLVDPTMLLTANEWDKIAKKPTKLKKKKYILNYYLGEMSEERKNIINKVAKENNCEIINLMDERNSLYASGPSEFLYLIKNAFLVCTDSFHGVVFSIIYNTPFIIFNRKDKNNNMNSRIDTLLNKFNLQYRKFNGKIGKEIFKSNYDDTLKTLESEQDKSKRFIEEILNS